MVGIGRGVSFGCEFLYRPFEVGDGAGKAKACGAIRGVRNLRHTSSMRRSISLAGMSAVLVSEVEAWLCRDARARMSANGANVPECREIFSD